MKTGCALLLHGGGDTIETSFGDVLPVLAREAAQRMRDFEDIPDDEIRGIAAPALVMVGDADVMRPQHMSMMANGPCRRVTMKLTCPHGAYFSSRSPSRRWC